MLNHMPITRLSAREQVQARVAPAEAAEARRRQEDEAEDRVAEAEAARAAAEAEEKKRAAEELLKVSQGGAWGRRGWECWGRDGGVQNEGGRGVHC